MNELRGGCYCRAVTYCATDPHPRPVIACHCKQCRQFTGYTYAATAVQKTSLTIEGAAHITWFQSSDFAQRGFCTVCGSALFWNDRESERISIAAGSVDDESHLNFGYHIYVDDQPSYYTLCDGFLKYAVRENGPTR